MRGYAKAYQVRRLQERIKLLHKRLEMMETELGDLQKVVRPDQVIDVPECEVLEV
jgi:hypothetical protein